jgi:hypothetical protein
MLKPVLEVYVVWHPQDRDGEAIANEIAEHFHGGAYASLLGGSMEVYMRSAGWASAEDSPRPIEWPSNAVPSSGVAPAQFVAVVPVTGLALNRSVNRSGSAWHTYLDAISSAEQRDPEHVRVIPVRGDAFADGHLAELLGTNQYAGAQDAYSEAPEAASPARHRDLAQGLAQWINAASGEVLQVFISHTKRLGTPDEPVAQLVADVRTAFSSGRISTFYDAHDLKAGADWDAALRRNAATSALLALRTDLYSTREWCQREMLTAKVHGMPIVILDALTAGEARGSFLMDHAPRIPVRRNATGRFEIADIRRAIDLLADAWLQRALWQRLQQQANELPLLDGFWWAPQAPEPSTLARWLAAPGDDNAPRITRTAPGATLRILHPDPPLAADETSVLQQITSMAGYAQLDLTTPRLLASRGV